MIESTKKMSEEWNSLDLKKKKKFTDLAAKESVRYETEKAIADANKPAVLKRPLTAFFIF